MAFLISLRNLTAAIFLSLTLPLPALSQTQIMQTHVASLGPAPEEVASQLIASSSDLAISRQNGVVMLSFAGKSVPSALSDLLNSTLPDLDQIAFEPGQPRNFSIALVPDGSGTELRLMMFQPKSAGHNIDLPAGSDILINDGHGDGCSGQIVVSFAHPTEAALPIYSDWLEAKGYDVTDHSDASTSFFIGNKTGCSVFVYIQPDPETQQRSTVVVRYLED